MRRAPGVIDGLRGPENREHGVKIDNLKPSQLLSGINPLEQKAIEIAAEKAPRKPAKTIIRRFQSRYPNYRVQITSPSDSYDPVSGIVKRARPIVAQFRDGFYSPDLDRTAEDPNMIDGRLRESRFFGVGNDFWDAEELHQAAQEAAVRQLIEVVQSASPEQQERVFQALKPVAGVVEFPKPSAPSAPEAQEQSAA